MVDLIAKNRERIAELCRTHHVRRLAVFGSAARGTDFDTERSDVDLLVEFEPLEYPASVENTWELKASLRAVLNRPVDLVREESVRNPYLLREILADRETVYASGS